MGFFIAHKKGKKIYQIDNHLAMTISGGVADAQRAVEILKDYGFQVRGSFMIGSPEERASDMQATFNFVKESRLDGGAVYLSLPLPGTEFWR